MLFLAKKFFSAFCKKDPFAAETTELVCIFAYSENNVSARASPRRRRASAPHLIIRVQFATKKQGRPKDIHLRNATTANDTICIIGGSCYSAGDRFAVPYIFCGGQSRLWCKLHLAFY